VIKQSSSSHILVAGIKCIPTDSANEVRIAVSITNTQAVICQQGLEACAQIVKMALDTVMEVECVICGFKVYLHSICMAIDELLYNMFASGSNSNICFSRIALLDVL
jgi:hypothetical protein